MSRFGRKWYISNGAIGSIRDTINSTVVKDCVRPYFRKIFFSIDKESELEIAKFIDRARQGAFERN